MDGVEALTVVVVVLVLSRGLEAGVSEVIGGVARVFLRDILVGSVVVTLLFNDIGGVYRFERGVDSSGSACVLFLATTVVNVDRLNVVTGGGLDTVVEVSGAKTGRETFELQRSE